MATVRDPYGMPLCGYVGSFGLVLSLRGSIPTADEVELLGADAVCARSGLRGTLHRPAAFEFYAGARHGVTLRLRLGRRFPLSLLADPGRMGCCLFEPRRMRLGTCSGNPS